MKLFPNSLNARVHILGVLILLFLLGCAVAFALLLRNTESQILSQSSSHVTAAAVSLARDYLSHVQFESEKGEVPPLQQPSEVSSDDVLSLMTTVALRHELGTEGGFYSQSGDKLLGYAFPTHEGPGVKKDMPQKELPTILALARKAASSGQVQSLLFRGPHDAIVFEAAPIIVNGTSVGSTWTMKRLPGVQSQHTVRTYLGFALLALGAAACVLVAFLIVRGLRVGINNVEARMKELESDLSAVPSSNHDVTEINRIHDGVERLAMVLRQKLASEYELERRLRDTERLAALGRIAAGVAHELRNPLATIRLRTQLSARDLDDENVRRNSDIILDEITRLNQMVERLLYFSRPIRMNMEVVDVCELLRTSGEMQEQLGSRKLQIKLEGCEKPVLLDADRSALRQVFDNLIHNAVEALHSNGGQVSILLRERGDGRVGVDIHDTGCGIQTRDLPHIFEPFFTTKQAGTGLGLSISYEIVKAHGGQIEVRSEVGRGTTMTVLLPAGFRRRPLAAAALQTQERQR